MNDQKRKEKVRKEYICKKYLQYVHRTIRNEVLYAFDFKGGVIYPRTRNGIYATSNPKLQDILESEAEYNKVFRLLKTIKLSGKVDLDLDPESITTVEKLDPTVQSEDEFIKIVGPNPITNVSKDVSQDTENKETDSVVVISEVNNFQKAKNAVYQMFKSKGMQMGDVNSKEKLSAIVKKHKIVFPDWPE